MGLVRGQRAERSLIQAAGHARRGAGRDRTLTLRELALALLPTLMSVVILLFGYVPVRTTLETPGRSWTGFAYQSLVNNMIQYRLDVLSLRRDSQTLQFHREQLESSLYNSNEFPELADVEDEGEARLSRVRALFAAGSLDRALREAMNLNTQAHLHLNALRQQYVAQLERARNLMLGSALASGLVGALLTLRLVSFWHAERRARQREAASTAQLLAMASHELRRPLQRLLLLADLLRAGDDSTGQRQDLLQSLEDAAVQVAARSDLGRLESLFSAAGLNWQSVDLNALTRRMEGGRVQVDLPPRPIMMTLDEVRTRQVLENLIENALKYARGPVRVQLLLNADLPEIHVIDDGPGIPEEQRERVFDPFYRLTDAASNAGGHGLGLTIARTFARAQGGDVLLLPEPGGGTRAVLLLGSSRR